MLTCKTVIELEQFLQGVREKELTAGFVPTMGALHEGHISLIEASLCATDVTISSVFVNPKQFNDATDLKKYPRMPESDAMKLAAAGCHCLFLPETEEIYPPGLSSPDIDLGGLDQTMEGLFRPGHFKGMAAVVDRLFSIVKPSKAFFGEKDFQQLAIIRYMARKIHPKTEVVGCPTMREPDGLAMSSRNMLLSPEQRAEAPLIYQTLLKSREWLRSMSPEVVKQKVTDAINQSRYLKVQYFEIVDPVTLATTQSAAGKMQGCIAVVTDGPRLIDNITYSI